MAESRKATSKGGDKESGELRGASEMDVALISGNTFTAKAVTYYNVDGVAIVEGDIALGPIEEVRRSTQQTKDLLAMGPNVAFGIGISGAQFRWPNCQIPYQIDPALPNQQRVTDAIAHWESSTAFRFPLRTDANAPQYPDYVLFTDEGGCWSLVGRRGGEQKISLGPNCSTGNAIHEIGHTVGLWHEQSREDRDLFVTILWQNIQAGMAAQFNQHITDGDDLGTYDYGSIMHYPRAAFSKDGSDTIVPTDANAQIGQRTGLSPGDVAAVRAMYPACAVKAPFAERPPVTKLARDHALVKGIADRGTLQPILKGPRDPGPVKLDLPGQYARPTVTPRPGTLQPFAIATPHHFGVAADPGGGDAEAYLASLQQQLLDVDAGLAQARATAAQANAEAARLEEAADALAGAYEQALGQPGGM